MCLRYIDDIFLIWEHGEEALRNFEEMTNNFHTSIKFTLESSKSDIPFLDTRVKIGTDNAISTSVFCKPTDKHTYLNYFSNHPLHIKNFIVFSQLLRHRRICSNVAIFDNQSTDLVGHFLKQGYPLKLLIRMWSRVRDIPRPTLLVDKPKYKSDRTPLIITHNKGIDSLLKNIKRGWDLLKSDTDLKFIFNSPMTVARRQPPSLRSMLVWSKLPDPNPQLIDNIPCGKSRCQVCDYMNRSESLFLKEKLHVGPFNCDSAKI